MGFAVAVFSPLLDGLADVPDPRRAQGRVYKLSHVLLFAILAIVTGCSSYRGVERRRSPGIGTEGSASTTISSERSASSSWLAALTWRSPT